MCVCVSVTNEITQEQIGLLLSNFSGNNCYLIRTDGWTDGQTDAQGENIYASNQLGVGIMKQRVTMPTTGWRSAIPKMLSSWICQVLRIAVGIPDEQLYKNLLKKSKNILAQNTFMFIGTLV